MEDDSSNVPFSCCTIGVDVEIDSGGPGWKKEGIEEASKQRRMGTDDEMQGVEEEMCCWMQGVQKK